MGTGKYKSILWGDVQEGDLLTEQKREISRRTVVSTAIATRDFQDVHHDHEAAKRSGVPDIFLNILTTGGLIGKFLTDWSGPEGELKKIDIKLAIPCFVGDTLTSTGKVIKKYQNDSQFLVDVEYMLATANGPHGRGLATLALPN